MCYIIGMKNSITEKYKFNKDDGIIAANILDKDCMCYEKCFVTSTSFLSLSQQNIINIIKKDLKSDFILFGGYRDAERKILYFVPDYIDKEDFGSYSDIVVLKVKANKPLSHHDYLGSLMGLGLKRESIGDILADGDSAQIITTKKIAEFINTNYFKAGHTPVSTEILSVSELTVAEPETKLITDTVMSLRLDAVISSAFGISRTAAAKEILAGKVFVNDVPVTKTDFKTDEHSKLTLRGKGKAVLSSVSGISKKGRIWIEIERYVR